VRLALEIRVRDAHSSISTTFARPDAPLRIDTCVLRNPNSFAISARSS